LFTDSDLTDKEFNQRFIANLNDNKDFKLAYFFAACIVCLIVRIATILQFNEAIGPLIKILGKMSTDFLNYMILSIMIIVMFALVGNINFIHDVESFKDFFTSVLTVIDFSTGNFDFGIFDTSQTEGLKLLG